jgi:hypothetical protein
VFGALRGGLCAKGAQNILGLTSRKTVHPEIASFLPEVERGIRVALMYGTFGTPPGLILVGTLTALGKVGG